MTPRLKNLNNKRLLADLLRVDFKLLQKVRKNKKAHYQEKILKSGRKVQALRGPLKAIHKRFKPLLDEFPLPNYVHSGRRGHSYKTNALVHLHATNAQTMDIKKFYPSCTSESVFRFFKCVCTMTDDVAWLVTDLLTIDGSVPTGSPISQILAFLANQKTFDQVAQAAETEKLNFTQYVDDMSFSSSDAIDPVLHRTVSEILRPQGLRLKRSKLKKFKGGAKEFTGVIIKDGKSFAPNRLKKKLFSFLDKVERDPAKLSESDFRSAIGVLRSWRTVEPNAVPMLYYKFRVVEKELALRENLRRAQQKVSARKLALK